MPALLSGTLPTPVDALLLVGAGVIAGIVNSMAGGGSLLTVPLLVMTGLPGTLANGTNRVGILVQSGVASWRFRAEGVSGFRASLPVLGPVLVGAALGAGLVSRVDDTTFERLFGILMIGLLVPTLWPPARARRKPATGPARLSRPLTALVFLGIGLYGGAFQAGVGILLVAALSAAGLDLVRANSIKMVVNLAFTAVAVPIFAVAGQIAWGPALVLATGLALGGAVGVRVAVRGGERVIRPVLAVSVLALAGRMLGLY